jgi:hypothetical protein
MALLALGTAACSSGGSSSSTTAGATTSVSTVDPPVAPVEDCTYTVNGQISTDLPTGLNPHFAAFEPDPSATAAIHSIAERGGTGIVDSFILPGKTMLRSGPSTTAPVVGTVPKNDELEVIAPVLWTDSSHDRWLGFFIACGGKQPYWASLADLRRTAPTVATTIGAQLDHLETAAPYTTTGLASTLPILVGPGDVLEWKDSHLAPAVGRGELTSAL